MTLLEISLIIFGVAIIILSYFISGQKLQITNVDVSPSIEEMNLKFESIKNDFVDKTEDVLSNISNEKIISVNDFSEQVLDKIKYNHEEVVFLYHMLEEKEQRIKKMMQEIDNKTKEQEEVEHQNNNDVIVNKELEEFNENIILEDGIQDKRDLILSMYKKNMSILEISKRLNIGQGEVQLVIEMELTKSNKGRV